MSQYDIKKKGSYGVLLLKHHTGYNVKRNLLYRIILAILGLLLGGYCVYLSGFSIELKVFIFLIISAGCLPWRGKVASKLYIGVIGILVVINFFYSIVPYGQYKWYNSAAINKFTHGIATQSEYVSGTGNADVILPMFLKEKIVYIDNQSPYRQYMEFFSKKIITSEMQNGKNVLLKVENMKDTFIYVGRMSISSLDFLFSQEDHDNITNCIVTQGQNPLLYMEKSEIATEDAVVILSDSNYNIYILTYDLYDKLN